MSRQVFINLPVHDLSRATAFFAQLGFSFDPVFTSDNATRMIVNDETSVMLAVEQFFQSFVSPQAVADTATSREVVIGLSATSREEVNVLVERAVAAGGQDLGGPPDDGFMFMRGFRDLDGHQWSFIFMDFAAMPSGEPA